MVDMGSVIKRTQIADQPEAADRSPTHVFDQAIVYLRLRGDHHRAPGVLAVVEAEKEAAAAIELPLTVDAQRKGSAAEASQTREDGEQVTNLAVALEAAGAHDRNIGGKSHT